MIKLRGKEKSLVGVVLMVLICTVMLATVSATTVDFGKSNQMFIHKVGIAHILGTGNSDIIKAGQYKSYPVSFAIIKPPINAPYSRKLNSSSFVYYGGYQTTLPVSYTTITPVPEQGSTPGGLVIRGPEGDWINMRSNFYSPSMGIYDGRWHYHVGTLPAYWENMAMPGSYTIQIAHKDTDLVYYCETVMVYPGQTTVIQVYNSMCPLCSIC